MSGRWDDNCEKLFRMKRDATVKLAFCELARSGYKDGGLCKEAAEQSATYSTYMSLAKCDMRLRTSPPFCWFARK